MPSIYAHYRFGAQLITKLPKRQQRTIARFRHLYNMGLQGPDIFYYQTLGSGNAMGDEIHAQTGTDFFEMACRSIRANPSEGAMAYLYGLLAHYALDSMSHPFINRMAQESKLSHGRIETEFDRFLLEQDGKKPAHMQDLSVYIRLTPGECQTVAAFYPKVTPAVVRKSVDGMASTTHSLVVPQGLRRKLLEKSMAIVSPRLAGRLMGVHPIHAWGKLNPKLLRLYDMAMDRYPVLLEQVQAHLRKKVPLGTDFSVPFC